VSERRAVVIDLGSNSFRLVVFTWVPGAWWKRTDEIHESVRVGAGLGVSGALQPEPMERALETIELYAHFCRAVGIDEVRPVATSAIRDATNQGTLLRRARERAGLEIEVLSPEAEARYGYLAVVNSTALTEGVALDLGGGSLQLVHVRDRRDLDSRSWPLGAVRMTERFLPDEKAKPKQLKELRAHVRQELRSAPWLGGSAEAGGGLAGIGGTLRNLATAAQLAAGLPTHGVQGFALGRAELEELVRRLAERPASKRGELPGIKRERGDLILAGAVVIEEVIAAGGFDAIEVTEAGMREGVFFSTLLEAGDPPLFDDMRRESVLNLARQYHADPAHTKHVARLALEAWDELASVGLHGGDPAERELLWAAAILHDIGTAVDYDDHHKHSRYLVLNAGLPGYSSREIALIAQMVRYHRKGKPSMGDLASLAREGDEDLLARCSAVLRLAEQFERARDQAVQGTRVAVHDGVVDVTLEANEDVSIARWAAQRQSDVFRRAFGRDLRVSAVPAQR
jgi:exopolyphosphatase / guanosine-5'-triphosphate,3'-diphosphate pyrophosphatase